MPSAVYPLRLARPLSDLPQTINRVHRFLRSIAAMFCARYKPCLERQDLEAQKINHRMSRHDATETKMVSLAAHNQETNQMLLLAPCLLVQTFSGTERSKPSQPKPTLPFSAVWILHPFTRLRSRILPPIPSHLRASHCRSRPAHAWHAHTVWRCSLHHRSTLHV